jgi:hypothetical protein
MNHAKVIAWGGLLSAALLALGFPRIAGLLMVIANVIVLGMSEKSKPGYPGFTSFHLHVDARCDVCGCRVQDPKEETKHVHFH